MKFWPFGKKSKSEPIETRNLVVAESFSDILSANANLKGQFEDLVKRFEKRIWTPEVCHMFKILVEDLFRHYGLEIEVTPTSSSSGAGDFKVRVISN